MNELFIFDRGGTEKIRRSKILLLLLIPVIMMWIPGIINGDMSFDLRGIPITPENNFLFRALWGWCGL